MTAPPVPGDAVAPNLGGSSGRSRGSSFRSAGFTGGFGFCSFLGRGLFGFYSFLGGRFGFGFGGGLFRATGFGFFGFGGGFFGGCFGFLGSGSVTFGFYGCGFFGGSCGFFGFCRGFFLVRCLFSAGLFQFGFELRDLFFQRRNGVDFLFGCCHRCNPCE